MIYMYIYSHVCTCNYIHVHVCTCNHHGSCMCIYKYARVSEFMDEKRKRVYNMCFEVKIICMCVTLSRICTVAWYSLFRHQEVKCFHRLNHGNCVHVTKHGCLLPPLQVGVTMAQTVLHPDMLEACVRDELNNTAVRWVGSACTSLPAVVRAETVLCPFTLWRCRLSFEVSLDSNWLTNSKGTDFVEGLRGREQVNGTHTQSHAAWHSRNTTHSINITKTQTRYCSSAASSCHTISIRTVPELF